MACTAIEGASSEELRQNYLRERAVPFAKLAFANDDEARSVLVVVSQFWNDEAVDAVHDELVISVRRDPTWPLGEPDNPFYIVEDDGTCYFELSERGEKALGIEPGKWIPDLPSLDENQSGITAFASFCRTGMHQEMLLEETGSVYAVIRRAEDAEPEVEVVGTMIQPGWEDRFDVGFAIEDDGVFVQRQAGDFSATPRTPEEVLAERVASGGARQDAERRPWWRRLLGR